jgi:hypothetical protein
MAHSLYVNEIINGPIVILEDVQVKKTPPNHLIRKKERYYNILE